MTYAKQRHIDALMVCVDKEQQGKGIASELIEYAFTKDKVYRVTTGCLKENIRSERVMQKNGLIKEAEHVDYEWHDGRMKTRLKYRLLKKEWEKR